MSNVHYDYCELYVAESSNLIYHIVVSGVHCDIIIVTLILLFIFTHVPTLLHFYTYFYLPPIELNYNVIPPILSFLLPISGLCLQVVWSIFLRGWIEVTVCQGLIIPKSKREGRWE